MTQRNHSERRKYPRIRSTDVVSFMKVNSVDKLGVGRDLSPGGIRFEAMGCEIDMGAMLRVNFYVGPTFISAVGKVVHATDIDSLTQDVGLEFVELDPTAAAILKEFYKEEFPRARVSSEGSQ
jgi:hypothetical protein